MRLLHTSDWHLGRMLFFKRRHDQFEAFLEWLLNTLVEKNIDILLVSGDIFDTTTPGNTTQKQYYSFLHRASQICRHIVITAGNHDSPMFLSAPESLLQELNVYVVATPQSEEILVLKNLSGKAEAIVCAVPYLRDRDVRQVVDDEGIDDKDSRLLQGIISHYEQVTEKAETLRSSFSYPVPIILMGHLFVAGGEVLEGDGVRELYVGSLSRVPASMFSDSIEYVALGHLHSAQCVGKKETIRYSGSPLAMSFSEAYQTKYVIIVDFPEGEREKITIDPMPIPTFQHLECIQGGLSNILSRIDELAQREETIWVEIIYDALEPVAELRSTIEDAVANTMIEVLRIKKTSSTTDLAHQEDMQETLEAMNPEDVFKRCLEQNNVSEQQQEELMKLYQEAVFSLHSEEKDG